MNRDKFVPDNHGASKVKQRKIVLRLLFKADEQLTEMVEKRVRDFNHPASGFEIGIMLDFIALFTSGANMGNILTPFNGLGAACISSIQAEILRMFLADSWTGNDDVIRRLFQKLDIVRICA